MNLNTRCYGATSAASWHFLPVKPKVCRVGPCERAWASMEEHGVRFLQPSYCTSLQVLSSVNVVELES